jgi:hypothetical protein
MFLRVSSLSTRDAEGTGHCGSGVFIGEELDGVGDKQSDNTKRLMNGHPLTLNLPMTTRVAQPFNVIKWQLKFNPAA